MIEVTEAGTGLSVRATLLGDQAPVNVGFLWRYLAEPRSLSSIHAMWTGPEFSCPIPYDGIAEGERDVALPLENATIMPQPGDLVLTWLAPRVWGGGAAPVFDLGLFYGVGARLLFPIGWQPGSVVARVSAEQLPALQAACAKLRQGGACTITYSRVAE